MQLADEMSRFLQNLSGFIGNQASYVTVQHCWLQNWDTVVVTSGQCYFLALRDCSIISTKIQTFNFGASTNDVVWSYVDPVRASLWSPLISNPQRLPNGNTLINEGLFGRFFEVTPDGDTVWEYVNPYFGPDSLPLKAQTNSVFRTYRYTADEIDRARSA